MSASLHELRAAIAADLSTALERTVTPARPSVQRAGHGYLVFMGAQPSALRSYEVKFNAVIVLGSDDQQAELEFDNLVVPALEAVRSIAIAGTYNLVSLGVAPTQVFLDSTTLFCLELQLLTEVEAV